MTKLILIALLAMGCDSVVGEEDASVDAGMDAEPDAGFDVIMAQPAPSLCTPYYVPSLAEVEAACQTVITTICHKYSDCEIEEYSYCYNRFNNRVCVPVIGVDRWCELIDRCIPYLENLSCPELNDPNFILDPSCRYQFVVLP